MPRVSSSEYAKQKSGQINSESHFWGVPRFGTKGALDHLLQGKPAIGVYILTTQMSAGLVFSFCALGWFTEGANSTFLWVQIPTVNGQNPLPFRNPGT